MPTKEFTYWLLYDWREDDIRGRKTKPSKGERRPTEQPLKVSASIEVPEMEIPELTASINVPRAQVKQSAYADLLGDDEDGPPWHDDVDAVLEAHDDKVQQWADDELPRETLVDLLTGAVLRRADGYPDSETVAEYVGERIYDELA